MVIGGTVEDMPGKEKNEEPAQQYANRADWMIVFENSAIIIAQMPC